MVIRAWFYGCVLLLALLAMQSSALESSARAQTPYKVDSSEHVGYLMTGSIGSTQSPPYWIRLTTGAGAYYARVGVPMLIELRDTTSDSAFYRKFELDSVSQIVGDSLYVVKRGLSNSTKYSWSAGTRAQIVNNNSIIISAIRRTATAINGLPDTTGQAGKYLLDSANGVGPVWTTVPSTSVAGVASFNARTGAVVPATGDYAFNKISGTAATTQGGTGLTSISPTKILYSPSANTFGPLTLSSDFTVTHDTLFGVGFQPTLPDTTGNAGKILKDSANGVGLIWSSAGAGTVQSVNVSGGSSGLTFGGGPIANAGTISINGGPLVLGYGGTGATTRAQGLLNLVGDTTGKTRMFLSVLAGGGIGFDTVTGSGGGGSGTVTSVNVAIPGMTSSGAVTTSGTITMSGTLAVANGGTALSTTPTNGKLLIGNGTNYTLALPLGTTNRITVTPGAGSLTFTTPQDIGTSSDVQFDSLTLLKPLPVTSGGIGHSTLDTGALLYGFGASALASLTPGSNGTVLQIASGLPAYTATLSSTVQGNITTLGTIASGTWNGTTIAPTYGGTGIVSPTIHKLLVANGSSAMTQIAVGATGTVLHGNSAADPSFSPVATADITDSNITAIKIATHAVDLTQQVSGQLPTANIADSNVTAVKIATRAVDLTQQVSGILPAANGGTANAFAAFTGPTTSTKTFTLPNASATLAYLAGGQTFTGGLTINGGLTLGTALPVTSGGTGLATLTNHAIQVGAGTSSPTQLGLGTSTTVLHGAAAGDPTWGAVSLTADVTGTLGAANGGTGIASPTIHKLLVGNGSSAMGQLALGTTTQVLHGNATGDPSWGAVSLTADVSGTLPVANGGTGKTTLLQYSTLIGNGTSAIYQSAARYRGTVLTSSGQNDYPAMHLQTAAGELWLRDSVSTTSSIPQVVIAEPFVTSTSPVFGSCYSPRSATDAMEFWRTGSFNLGEITVKMPQYDGGSTSTTGGAYLVGLSSSPNGAIYTNRVAIPRVISTGGSFDTTITDARVHANSHVFVLFEGGSTGWYLTAYVLSVAEGSFGLRIQSIANGGQTGYVNYAVIESSPDGRIRVGSIDMKNTTGSTTGVIKDTVRGLDSVQSVILTTVGDADTAAGIAYVANMSSAPTSSLCLKLSAAKSTIVNNSGCRVNYAVFTNSSVKSTQDNWTFAGAPVAVTNTSNQIVLGSGTTSTLNIPTGTSDTITFPSTTGTLALTGAVGGGTGQTSYATGDMLYASATNTLSKLTIGATNKVMTVVSGVPAWAPGIKIDNAGAASTCGTAVLVGGSATVSTTAVTGSSLVFLTDVKGGGLSTNIGSLYVDAVASGTSFTVKSANSLDNSSFNWLIVNP